MEEAITPTPQPEQQSARIGADGTGVVTTETMTQTVQPNPAIEKVIVAVHGIGDQYNYATIQSVVNQFCGYYGQPAAVPLGSFHNDSPAYSIPKPFPQDKFGPLTFAEVYWAPIPRELAGEKHTLEEAKAWARTIIERVRLRWKGNPDWQAVNCRDEDFRLTQQVLGEMIQTIAVVDRLCYLADKAGLFTFDLRKLLDDYLGDVQIVAEFKKQRDEILASFDHLLGRVAEAFPNANIYFVAHSEGTVVTLLGLLRAFRAAPPPAWTRKVRGLMTLGSPIDKHLALWPELFEGTGPSPAAVPAPENRIEWRNYYDYGDPVGFELEGIREWIHQNQWSPVFDFEDRHDIGFTRYPLPGKAHVDYWTDGAVFKHFIGNVIEREPRPQGAAAPAKEVPKPETIPLHWLVSYVMPYVGVLALFFLAAYVLVKSVTGTVGYTCPNEDVLTTSCIFRHAGGLAALLVGITALARIPRLTKDPFWRSVAVGVMALCAFLYLWNVRTDDPTEWGRVVLRPGVVTLTIGVLAALVASFGARKWPALGLKPLMVTSALAMIGLVLNYLFFHYNLPPRYELKGSAWPVLLATAGSLYLWWLAALIFDLVFIWHLYIRNSRLIYRLNEVVGNPYGPRTKPGKKTASSATPGTPPQPAHP